VPETISYLIQVYDSLYCLLDETHFLFFQAGIHFWVLTGDKQETAIEIGKSCKIITEGMDLIKFNAGGSSEECAQVLSELMERYSVTKTVKSSRYFYSLPDRPFWMNRDWWRAQLSALMQYGTQTFQRYNILARLRGGGKEEREEDNRERTDLSLVVDGATLKYALKEHLSDFIDLATICRSVICCRTSPLQKVRAVLP